ncbi:hypothetical protein GCM10025770_13730 [Viridibacterium curvum]|uniref:Exo-alpha-sialidase n=2 Tax=Viridibacterium curvum TaxID=1101404 RepID=A0ABP9QIX6_9RHOO
MAANDGTTPDLGAEHTGYSTFIKPLPPGTHQLQSLSSGFIRTQAGKQIIGQSFINFLAAPRVFTIKAGEISDLGTLAIAEEPVSPPAGLSPANAAKIPSKAYVMQLDSHAAEAEQMLSIIQAKAPALKMHQGSSWVSPVGESRLSRPELRQGLSAQLLSAKESGGQTYAGEAWGQVRVRQAGRWAWLDTGLSHDISAVDVLEDGRLLAGGSLGIIRAKSPVSNEWQTWRLPFPDGVVKSIGHSAALGIVVGVQNGDQLVVVQTPSLGEPWREMKRFNAFGSVQTDLLTSVASNGFTAIVVETSFTTTAKIHHYSLATQQWSEQALPTNFAGIPGAYTLSRDGRVFTTSGSPMFSQNLRVSDDGGKTWTAGSSPQWMTWLTMVGDNRGYAVRQDSSSSPTPASLWKTSDGARSWLKTGPLPGSVSALIAGRVVMARIVVMGERELALITPDNKLYVSRDEGASWTADTFE